MAGDQLVQVKFHTHYTVFHNSGLALVGWLSCLVSSSYTPKCSGFNTYVACSIPDRASTRGNGSMFLSLIDVYLSPLPSFSKINKHPQERIKKQQKKLKSNSGALLIIIKIFKIGKQYFKTPHYVQLRFLHPSEQRVQKPCVFAASRCILLLTFSWVSVGVGARKGGCPTSISKRITPTLHQSQS